MSQLPSPFASPQYSPVVHGVTQAPAEFWVCLNIYQNISIANFGIPRK